jgi:hypothetical protein
MRDFIGSGLKRSGEKKGQWRRIESLGRMLPVAAAAR